MINTTRSAKSRKAEKLLQSIYQKKKREHRNFCSLLACLVYNGDILSGKYLPLICALWAKFCDPLLTQMIIFKTCTQHFTHRLQFCYLLQCGQISFNQAVSRARHYPVPSSALLLKLSQCPLHLIVSGQRVLGKGSVSERKGLLLPSVASVSLSLHPLVCSLSLSPKYLPVSVAHGTRSQRKTG